jgi:2-polyprenyl-3-methyl-5-hydroxy-6-metoxy-1,4-benzoquinol methylase
METIRTPGDIMQIANGFRMSRVLLTAYELGLFTVLGDGSKTSGETAKALKTDPRATDRLMNALTAIGLLQKKGDKFSNAKVTSEYLVEGKPKYMGGMGHIVNLWDTWSTMTEAVREGTTVLMRGHVNDRQPDWLESFIAAMHTRARDQAPKIASAIDLTNVSSLLDVGGGSGAFSFAFVRAKKGLKVTVFDLPNVVVLTKKYIEMEGLGDFVNTANGDYLTDDLGSGYDLVFLSAIIHSNSPDENKMLFKKCENALNKGRQLVVLDHIMSEDRTEPVMGALFALNMLVGTPHGDTYTESEIESWMKEAGLSNIARKNTNIGTDMIIGHKG